MSRIIFTLLSSNFYYLAFMAFYNNFTMKKEEERISRTKIGRPNKTEQGAQFKRQYLVSETKFQIECQLLVTIHEEHFIQPPLDPQNRRVQISYITALFQKHNCLKIYQILLKLNQFYYKNSSIFPEDRIRYTSLIDISYMVRQLRIHLGEKLRCIQLVLTVIFYLYNQKLINLAFYQYIQGKVEDLEKGIVADPAENKKLDRVLMLIITLVLEVCVREEIKIKR